MIFESVFSTHNYLTCLVLLMDFGKWDVRKSVDAGKLDRLLRYFDKMLDEAEMKVLEMQSMGKNVTQWLWLVDQDGVSLSNHVSFPS
jgi:hypothetical protein